MFNFGHHGQNQPADPPAGVGAGAGGVHQPTFKIFSRAEENYCLTVRDGNVVLAPASRFPLLPFLVLALAIAAAMVAGPAVAAEATHLPPNAAVWSCLALAVSFHVAVGSIYCFVANRPPPAVAGAEPRSRSEAPGAIVASLASAAAVGVTSYLLVAGGAASGDRSLGCSIKHSSVDRLRFKTRTTHFLVFCLVMGALPYAGQLVAAARELHLHPAMVACIVLAVAGLFHWAVLSLNFLVARRQAEEEPKPQPRPAATTAAPTASALRLARPHFLVLCLVVGALPYAEQLVTAAGELHLHPDMVAYIVLAVAGLFDWAVLSLNFLVARRQAEEEPKPQPRPAATTAAPTASASRLARPHFLVLCLVVGALPYAELLVTAAGELHLHPAMVACIVLAVAGLFDWAVLSLNFLVARRQAEEEPKPQPRPSATTAAPTASASRLARPHFLVLCLVVGALPYAEQLVTAAGELHLHPDMVACIVLAVAGLFDWAVLSLNFLVARRQAEEEPKPQPRPAATTAAPTASASASRLARPHFLVLCLVVGVLPYAEQLVTAAGDLHLHPTMVACIVLAIAGLFHWAVLSLNLLVARRQAEEEPKPQPRPAATTAAPTAPASRLPLLPFLVLALAIVAAMVAGPAVAEEAIHLPPNAAVWACLALAVSFHVAIGSIYCFVVNRPPPAVAGAEPWSRSEAPGAIVASLASAAVGVTSYLLVAGGAASGDRSARI